MKIVKQTRQFRKDYKKLKRSGNKNIEKLNFVMEQLIDGKKLSSKYQDHGLKGEWNGCRDCHIEDDWVLVYENIIDNDGKEVIIFHATDNHSNLFD